jgi:hypothetical protein
MWLGSLLLTKLIIPSVFAVAKAVRNETRRIESCIVAQEPSKDDIRIKMLDTQDFSFFSKPNLCHYRIIESWQGKTVRSTSPEELC